MTLSARVRQLLALGVFAALLLCLGLRGVTAEEEANQVVVRRPGFLGRDSDGAAVFIDDAGRTVLVSETSVPSTALFGIPLEVVGRVETASSGDNYLRIASAEPNALLKWWTSGELSDRMTLTNELQPLRAAFRTLDTTFVRATIGEEGIGADTYRSAFENVAVAVGQASLVQSWDDLTNSVLPEAARQALAQWRGYKAIYGRDDVYHPHIFRSMYEHSRGTLALVDTREDKVYGSGVLVGEDLVLTCAHCLYRDMFQTTKYDPTDLSVRLDYESPGPYDDLPAMITFPVLEVVAEGGEGGPDYAILKIGKGQHGALPAPERAQRLSRGPVQREDAVYVVGHPEGNPRSIADNGFVLFPYQVDRRMFKIIAGFTLADVSRDPDGDAQFEAFKRSYHERDGMLFYRSARWGDRPTIGADCDTFHGNSGSGVFLKRSHALVGIVYAGEPDHTSDAWVPSWRRHEAIAPAVAIIEDLERFGGAKALGVLTD